jgi:LmbE family N-acetylglucosaminyl deacetylase
MSARPIGDAVVVVAAHPDDETLAMEADWGNSSA